MWTTTLGKDTHVHYVVFRLSVSLSFCCECDVCGCAVFPFVLLPTCLAGTHIHWRCADGPLSGPLNLLNNAYKHVEFHLPSPVQCQLLRKSRKQNKKVQQHRFPIGHGLIWSGGSGWLVNRCE